MIYSIGQVALLVKDYQEALDFYCQALGFELIERTIYPDKEWIRIAPAGGSGTELLLSKASTPEQLTQVGRQAGGRVFLYLYTHQIDEVLKKFTSLGGKITEGPKDQPYGRVAVILDLYGNRLDLIQPTPKI